MSQVVITDDSDVRFYVPRRTPLRLDEAKRQLLFHQEKIAEFGVTRLGICGSVVRNEATPNSDLDLVIEMDLSLGTKPSKRYFGLIAYLEQVFHCEIDLLTREDIRPHARESIEREAVWLF